MEIEILEKETEMVTKLMVNSIIQNLKEEIQEKNIIIRKLLLQLENKSVVQQESIPIPLVETRSSNNSTRNPISKKDR